MKNDNNGKEKNKVVSAIFEMLIAAVLALFVFVVMHY